MQPESTDFFFLNYFGNFYSRCFQRLVTLFPALVSVPRLITWWPLLGIIRYLFYPYLNIICSCSVIILLIEFLVYHTYCYLSSLFSVFLVNYRSGVGKFCQVVVSQRHRYRMTFRYGGCCHVTIKTCCRIYCILLC